MPTTTVTPATRALTITTYIPTVTVGDVQSAWTRMVFGANPKDRMDAANGGVCAITGVWYPASKLKTVNGRRIFVRIPIQEGLNEPTANRDLTR